MEFVIGDEKTDVKVKLTLRKHNLANTDMVYLEANGMTVMGLKAGKYRLFSNADGVDGLVMENGLIVQDQTL